MELTNSEQAALAVRNAELEAEVRELRELVHSERFRELNQWKLKTEQSGDSWGWSLENSTIIIQEWGWRQQHRTAEAAEAAARAIARLFGIQIAESEDSHD
jgi:hypothetical protein